MLFFNIFPYISVAEGDTWTVEMFCIPIPARGELVGHHKYENWTEYAARWVLDKAEVGLLKQEASSLLTTSAGLWYAAVLIHMQKFL